jgi:hypothetical protein
MKNWKFLALAITFMGLLAWQTHQQKKTYKVEAPIEFWIQLNNGIEFTKNNLKVSDLPSKTVTIINDTLFTPVQMEITRQINAQLAAEQKKDSTTNKPKK